ncbi:FUSC family membrane protein [Crenobacter sp. SG2303]|uniref:FUSC family membrane protein n=1 Tax=Crenobacter oryzisoli TaxID=3056844 RepID=A0ABT7XU08_9NEIS|nr:FUSC family membrane protein [Crenobacter sp. SG2303]MDN0077215.1 FUSC family membrane protein [Crenobacter sp. SG2303]
MLDSASVRRFLYSQHIFTALRMTIGIALPAVVLMIGMGQIAIGMACAIGALCVGLIDVPGPLRRKHREMLGCALVVSLTAGWTMLGLAHPALLWPTVLGISFFGAFAVAFGQKASIVGLNAMLVMVIGMTQHGTFREQLAYLAALTIGGLGYTYYSLAVCQWLRYQMWQRALAECLFATARYFDRRADCYDPVVPLELCYRELLAAQMEVETTQQNARDLVLNAMAGRHPERLGARRSRLFNLFIDVIDLHDMVLAAQTDFALLREHFADGDSLDFLRDLMQKTALDLEACAEALASSRLSRSRYSVKAELRALAYDIEAARQVGLPGKAPEAFAALLTSQQRVSVISRLIAKLHDDTGSLTNTTGLPVDKVVERFRSESDFGFSRASLSFTSSALRYALRFTVAMAAALFVSRDVMASGHGNWILLTVLVALRPGFGLSRQRGRSRLFGTLAGCAATLLVLLFVHDQRLLFALMIVSLWLSFGLMQLNYLASVFFTSIEVLLLYHFLVPSEMALIGERALDTLIGAAIAAVASWLFPFWESQLVLPQLRLVLDASCRYLATALGATEPDNLDYRLLRRDTLTALSALKAMHERMLLEPTSKRRAEHALSELLLKCYLLVSQVAALNQLFNALPARRGEPEVRRCVAAAGRTLQQAEQSGKAPTEPEPPSRDANLRALQVATGEIAELVQRIRSAPVG